MVSLSLSLFLLSLSILHIHLHILMGLHCTFLFKLIYTYPYCHQEPPDVASMASHQWPASRPCKSLRRGRPRSKVWLILDDDGRFFPNFTWRLRNFSDPLHFFKKFILPLKSATCFFGAIPMEFHMLFAI